MVQYEHRFSISSSCMRFLASKYWYLGSTSTFFLVGIRRILVGRMMLLVLVSLVKTKSSFCGWASTAKRGTG